MKTHFGKTIPLALLAAAALFVFSQIATARTEVLATLGKAPAVTFRTLDGKDVSLASLKGKVVVVDFWATWCPPCVAEMPGFQQLQDKYEDKGLVFVGVSLDQRGAEHVQRFLKAKKITYRVAMGDDEMVDAFGGFDAIPTTFLIDRDGNIRHRKTGGMETGEYEKLLSSLL